MIKKAILRRFQQGLSHVRKIGKQKMKIFFCHTLLFNSFSYFVCFWIIFFIYGDFISAKFTQSAQQLLVVVPVAKQD